MKTTTVVTILFLFLSSIFLAPTIGVGPSYYDGYHYSHIISIKNPYHQPINDLYFIADVDGYFDHTYIDPMLQCEYSNSQFRCELTQKIANNILVIVRTTDPQPPKIIVAERNTDSHSLPKQLTIRDTQQVGVFIPLVVR